MTRFASSMTGNSPLDNSQLMKFAPSIFAAEPYHKMSAKYGFVPTIEVIERLRKEGFLPFKAMEARTRIDDKRGFLKHLIRLRHVDTQAMVGGLFPEIVLVNSHDGASAYQMHAGIFRLVCSNGMIVADSTFEKLSIRHSGTVWEEAINNAMTIGQELPRIEDQVQQFSSIELTKSEQGVFAAAALELRWPKNEDNKETAPITVEQLLRPRRYEDNKNDLFTTMNRCQESLIKGGIKGKGATNRRMTTRAVTGVDGDIRLNKAIWSLTERMAKLKAA